MVLIKEPGDNFAHFIHTPMVTMPGTNTGGGNKTVFGGSRRTNEGKRKHEALERVRTSRDKSPGYKSEKDRKRSPIARYRK